jgi:hypothetical protein
MIFLNECSTLSSWYMQDHLSICSAVGVHLALQIMEIFSQLTTYQYRVPVPWAGMNP